MSEYIDKINNLIIYYKNAKKESKKEKIIYDYLKQKKTKSNINNKNKKIVLVQCSEKPFYFGLFGCIINELKKYNNVSAEQYILRSMNAGESKSIILFLIARFLSPIYKKKWSSLYHSFCDRTGYYNNSVQIKYDIYDLYRAILLWREIKSKESIIKLSIDGIYVGDLINDSYLRLKPSPTVDINDKYLILIIWQAHRNIRRAYQYMKDKKPDIYLTTYTTYIEHGVPVRVALKCGVHVYSFGDHKQFIKKLTNNSWTQSKYTDEYSKEFKKIQNKDECIKIAEREIDKRISGDIDAGIGYMKKSAYKKIIEDIPNVEKNIIIFLHDFYDSPHCYREMVFPDFWEWICYTIEILNNAEIPFYIKPHPNQIPMNDQVIKELKNKYPYIRLLSSDITNKQLVDGGMICAVTVYGTVAHEMAYFGINVICCGDNPHNSYEFCYNAKNKEEYKIYLQKSRELTIEKEKAKMQSLEFYFMHNINITESMKKLRDMSNNLRDYLRKNDHEIEKDELIEKIEDVIQLEEYKERVKSMILE
jgi:hypothetical protein